MWIIANLGFFSVVEAIDDQYQDTLTVQAQLKEDLEFLREQVLPTLGPISTTEGSDYRFEAKCLRNELATALGEIVLGINYGSLKEEARAHQGEQRSYLYHKVWCKLHELQSSKFSGSYDAPSKNAKLSYGGVLMDRQRGVLLRKPKGEFDGYVWTFAKGRHQPGRTPEETALHEVRKKMGYNANIVAKIPGRFEGGDSITEYFLMYPVGDSVPFDPSRTEAIRWVPLDEAAKSIAATKNPVGIRRDQGVLDAVARLLTVQATRLAWDLREMPDRKLRLPFQMRFSRNELARLKRGSIPLEMDDHWFIYFETDWANFHRSWTGYCIYKLRFEPDGECYRVAEAWVNRDPEQCSNQDVDEENKMLLGALYSSFRIGSDPWKG